jgi:WD40 repeat protein
LIVSIRDYSIKLWEVSTYNLVKTFYENIDIINSVSFSPNGKKIAIGIRDGSIVLWEISTGNILKTIPKNSCSSPVKFCPVENL